MLNSLSYDRILQVTLGTLVSATRFKMLEGSTLKNVKCPNCGDLDSWEHCKTGYNIRVPTHKEEKAWAGEMDQIMNKLCTLNPALNAKHTEKEDAIGTQQIPQLAPENQATPPKKGINQGAPQDSDR